MIVFKILTHFSKNSNEPKSFKNIKFDILSNRVLIKCANRMQLDCVMSLLEKYKNAKNARNHICI